MTTQVNQIVYTNENDCQDCYKCVRNCPVKAISMIDNHASIDEDRCIYCGKCISVCPAGAQKYRNDEETVKQLLLSEKKVILAIAPSFVSEFNIPPETLLIAAEKLGFYGVSETALGAQLVTWYQREIGTKTNNPSFSTACPTFVNLILKYFPKLKNNLSELLSPLLAQCTMLKEIYKENLAIVFVGPCLAKKWEADIHPDLLDVALTFDELKNIIKDAGITLHSITPESSTKNNFIPIQSNGGAIYPLDGGMIETLKKLSPSSVTDTAYFHYTGVIPIQNMLKTENFTISKTFCEFLACEGGCINGSGIFEDETILTKKNRVAEYFKSLTPYPEEEFIKQYAPKSIKTNYDICPPVKETFFPEEKKKKIWHQLGKYEQKDFIDCGACGYDTCDNFAIACLENRAELEMCATCMKKKAQNKVRAFMKETPLALCVVNDKFKVIECNYKFIQISIDVDIEIDDSLVERVIGGSINKFFPLNDLITRTIRAKERRKSIINKEGKIFDILAFPFENEAYVGLIIQDITKPSMKREVVVEKAQKVIQNHLSSVQKIAFLLGETAAETEITLNEIIDAYNSKEEN